MNASGQTGQRSPGVEVPLGPQRLRQLGLALFIVATAVTFLTVGDYGIVSDVGNYFYSSLRQLTWLRRFGESVLAGEPTAVLTRSEVFEHWRWYLERIPHPPLSRELGGVSWLIFGRLIDPLSAYRVAAVLTYGALVATCGVFAAWAARSVVAGITAGGAALTIPALFAHGHLAHTDLFLTAFWFWSAACLAVYVGTGKGVWVVRSGMLMGAAAATKFSGLLLLPVLAMWLMAHRKQTIPALATLLLSGALVFVIVNPVVWVDPGQAFADYFGAGLGRGRDPSTRILTEYFGTVYGFRPPWHYPFVWTAIVLPIPLALAAAAGVASRRDAYVTGFALLNMSVLYGALLLPAAPLHDGIRLFLPVFPFIAVLAGTGTSALVRWGTARAPTAVAERKGWVAACVILVVLWLPVLRTVQYHPYQLSYFNALIGGVRGAERRGLEVTNLKEVLNREVLADLSEAIPEGATVDPGFLLEEICFYRAVGWAPAHWHVVSPSEGPGERPPALTCEGPRSFVTVPAPRPAREPEFVFILNRKALWRRIERALATYDAEPFYEIALQGVPLFRVYRTR